MCVCVGGGLWGGGFAPFFLSSPTQHALQRLQLRGAEKKASLRVNVSPWRRDGVGACCHGNREGVWVGKGGGINASKVFDGDIKDTHTHQLGSAVSEVLQTCPLSGIFLFFLINNLHFL